MWANDKGVRDYLAFMKNYYPEGDPNNILAVTGYGQGQVMVYILEQCGNNLTRANVMPSGGQYARGGISSPTAGCQNKYQPDKLSGLQPDAAHEVRWQTVGSIWRHHQRLKIERCEPQSFDASLAIPHFWRLHRLLCRQQVRFNVCSGSFTTDAFSSRADQCPLLLR